MILGKPALSVLVLCCFTSDAVRVALKFRGHNDQIDVPKGHESRNPAAARSRSPTSMVVGKQLSMEDHPEQDLATTALPWTQWLPGIVKAMFFKQSEKYVRWRRKSIKFHLVEKIDEYGGVPTIAWVILLDIVAMCCWLVGIRVVTLLAKKKQQEAQEEGLGWVAQAPLKKNPIGAKSGFSMWWSGE